MLLMTGVVSIRLRSHLSTTLVPDLLYLPLAVFLAWGRLVPEPF